MGWHRVAAGAADVNNPAGRTDMTPGITADEFVCRDCRRLIIVFPATRDAAARICSMCRALPGWAEDPRRRDLIDPELAAAQADAAAWASLQQEDK